MPQNPLIPPSGGTNSALNVTAAKTLKSSPGRVARITIVAPGSTGGAFTLNDCLTVTAATTSNEVWSLAYNATANVGGAVFNIDWPFKTGIVLSAVPTGGSPIASISYS